MLPLGFASFLLFGVLLVLVGASHVEISLALDLSLSQTSALGAAVALGLGAGLTLGGPLVDRWPRRPLFQGAVALVAVSLLAIEDDMRFGRAFAQLALAGAGAGLYETVLNAGAIQRFGGGANRPIAFMHGAATLGAMAAPLGVGWALGVASWTAAFHGLGVAHALLLLASFSVRIPDPPPPPTLQAAPAGSLRSPVLVALGLAAFAYVGTEVALTLLAVPYATEALGLAAGRGRVAISVFWLGLLTGRLALAVVGSRADERVLVVVGGAAAAVLALGFGSGAPWLEAQCAVVGLLLGGVFPLLVSVTGQRFPEHRGTALGLVTGFGSLGGFAIPWLAGLVGEDAGLPAAVGGLALACLAMSAAAFVVRWYSRA